MILHKMPYDDQRLCSLYRSHSFFRTFISDLINNKIDIQMIFNSKDHICCRSCTIKILCHYNPLDLVPSIFAILTMNIKDLHINDIDFPFSLMGANMRKTRNDMYKIVKFDEELFWIFYEYNLLPEYSRFLSIEEILIIFKVEVTVKSINLLLANVDRSYGVLDQMLTKMKNRKKDEQILFCRFLEVFVSKINKGDITLLMNYCISLLEIEDIALIYGKLKELM